MGPAVSDYLLVGTVAALVTFSVTPLVRWVATRYQPRGWLVEPNARSVHTTPIPHVGGIALLVGFLTAMLLGWSLDSFDVVFDDSSEPLGIILAVLIVFVVGHLDDVRDMAPPAKVTGIVFAAMVLVWSGATMFYFRVPFLDVILLSGDWTPLVTALWLLGLTQAINLIDGLDGLAAGIVAIAAAAFFVYSLRLNELGLLPDRNAGPLVAVIAVGVCIGFLPHNFNPARIFMGDSGAFLLGTLMAVSTSLVGGRADPNTQDFVGQTFFFLAPLAIPLLILGVPLVDTVFAIIRRASQRQALDVADKGHLHHRLMNLGHGHRRSVLILWAWTALLSSFVLYPVLSDQNPSYLTLGIGALAIVLFTVLHPSVRRKRADEVEAALDRPASEQIDPSRPERRESAVGRDAERDAGRDVDGGEELPASGTDGESTDRSVEPPTEPATGQPTEPTADQPSEKVAD